MRACGIGIAVALALGGCNPVAPLLLREALRPREDAVAVVPTGDGAQYVSITSESGATPAMLGKRWRRVAQEACDGDYLVLSENGTARQAGGRVAGRTHEGFVRCVSPEANLKGIDRPPDAGAQATAGPSSPRPSGPARRSASPARRS